MDDAIFEMFIIRNLYDRNNVQLYVGTHITSSSENMFKNLNAGLGAFVNIRRTRSK